MPVALRSLTYRFFPVGQGLFAYGRLGQRINGKASFRWVYDCGTVSPQNLIDRALDRFDQLDSKLELALVAVSHFDRDHVSGLSKLLARFRIRRLLLPYMSLTKRLLLAFADGVDTQDDRFRLYLDPVQYFLDIDGAEIDEIILVPATGESGSPPLEGGGVPPPEDTEEPWQVSIDEEQPPEGDQREEIEEWGRAGTVVRYLRPGGRINVAGVWEFVPYNDADLDLRVTVQFRKAVEQRRDKLLERTSRDQVRRDALRELRGIYDRTFGANAYSRNLISLFLYAGPTNGALAQFYGIRSFNSRSWYSYFVRERVSILYSGDGYLDTPKRLLKLKLFLGESRINRLAIFQVMHHGAEANWHLGVAKSLNPDFSVFSSDPDHRRLRHPHALVLRDFWTHRPMQVDRSNECAFCGVICQ